MNLGTNMYTNVGQDDAFVYFPYIWGLRWHILIDGHLQAGLTLLSGIVT